MKIKSNILVRYFSIILIVGIAGFGLVLFKAGTLMFWEKEYWSEVNNRNIVDSILISPTRGNIFSSDGKLLASSIPEYEFRMDLNSNSYQRKELKKRLTEISKGLHNIFPDKSTYYFKTQITKGIRAKDRYRLIYPRRINYIDLQKVKSLPLFNEGRYKSGLVPKEFNYRKKPFNPLASRTIGDMYPDIKEGAKNGLELAFDKELRGIPGKGHRQKIRNRFITITDTPPKHGHDIVTTIDMDIQDISDQTLRNILESYHANTGIVIIMEVNSGDIKAVVNLTKTNRGFQELKNNAFADLYEQGSTVKTASILIALDDNKITLSDTYDLGNGTYKLYDRYIKDHNFRRGGFKEGEKVKTIEEIVISSSNIGVGRTIEDHYKDNKQRFVDRFKEMLGVPLNLPIPGSATPSIKDADDKYFSNTTLAWMSFGYETLIPPINIVTFYNAIANKGKMMAPRLVKSIENEGKEIKFFPIRVINNQIASSKSISQMQHVLKRVVTEGTARKYGSSELVTIAGKTGSAQIFNNSHGYKGGNKELLASFCGYFPADTPQYTCLVSIKSNQLYTSGGREAALVAKEIAERITAMKVKRPYLVQDANFNKTLPDISRGLYAPSLSLIKELKFDYTDNCNSNENSIIDTKKEGNKYVISNKEHPKGLIPSVYGMGAKDAIYILESKGLHVNIYGKGKVYRQSIPPGRRLTPGTTIRIELK